MALYDMFFARREGGDPTTVSAPVESTSYGNPGFREQRSNGKKKIYLLKFAFCVNVSFSFLRGWRFYDRC